MKNKNVYLIVAGLINLLTALLHTFAGQIDLINPLMDSNIELQTKSELLSAWHIVTILLFATAFILLKNGFRWSVSEDKTAVRYIGYLYILFCIPFIVVSFMNNLFAPQWILLLPIGLLSWIGQSK
jgi:hypothetical protein